MNCLKTRIWYRLLIVSTTLVFQAVLARESRKEPDILPVPLGVNLLKTPTDIPANHDDGGAHSNSKDPEISIDYDYFIYGMEKSGSQENANKKSKIENPSIKDSYGNHHGDAYYYDYGAEEASYGDHDPYSVFYDSLFSVMHETEGIDSGNDKASPRPSKGNQKVPEQQPPIYTTRFTPPPSLYASSLTSIRPSQPIEVKPSHRPSVVGPHYIPRRNNSMLQRYQKIPRPRPNANKTNQTLKADSVSTASKPMDLTHLKVLMPKILEKFGLPKSFGEKLFKDEAALQQTLLQIIKDKAFRNALSMIPKLDLLSTDMTSILSTLSSLDTSLIMNVMKNADLSKFTSLLSTLGIDMSYLSGVFNRAGAAANYSPKEGDDDSKLIYIPLLDAGSVNNVQVFGFIVIMFFLLTTAYAYLEYGAFTTSRRDGPIQPMVDNEQLLGWGQMTDIWLPAVDATEGQAPWNPPPPIHILQPPTESPRPPTLPPRTARPPPPPPPRVRPVFRPVRRRFRPKLRRRYPQRHQTKNDGHLSLNSQEILQLTRRRPSYRPVDRMDRIEAVYYDYYDDYYDDDHDYYYDEDDYDYYDPPSYRQSSERSRIGSINYKYYPATTKPSNHPYSFYNFPGPRATDDTRRTSPLKSTTTTTTTTAPLTTTTTTTTAPPTRPTSRYADTIRTGRPSFTSQRE